MIRYFAAHPTAANLLMVLLIAIGLVAAPGIKRETFPEFSLPQVEVSLAYPGASPEDVEEAVCRRLEDAAESLVDVAEIRCEARESLARMVVEFAEETDIGARLLDVKNEVDAIDDFPAEVESPRVQQLDRTEQVVTLAVSAMTDRTALKDYAEGVKRRLQQWPGISLVEITGFSDRQVRVELSELRLRQYQLSVNDVAGALARQNIRLPGGRLDTPSQSLLIRIDQQRVDADALGDVVVASSTAGAEVRLRDIATLEERFELDEERIELDGRPTALLVVNKNKSEDSLELFERVAAFLETERARTPPGVELTLTRDRTSLIRDRLRMLLGNGWQGLLLVFGTLWLFFSIRFSFWVAMGLPVSFLATLFVMTLTGMTLNMITMVGLLMAIGLLMDDALVIAEAIAARVERGMAPLEGAVAAVREVGPGVVSSFLTTLAIFGGIAMISGQIGQVLKVMPIVLIIALSVSLLEAFLILPRHLAHSLEGHAERPPARGFKAAFQRRFERLREQRLPALVARLIRWRYAFVGGVLGLLLASIALPVAGLIRFSAFPELEGDLLEVKLLLTPGAPLAETEAAVARVVAAVAAQNAALTPEQPDGAPLVRHLTVEYNRNSDAFESGQHLATLTLDLLSVERRRTSALELARRLREAIGRPPGVVSLIIKEPAGGPAGKAVEIRLLHDDLALLERASDALQQWLRGYTGTRNVLDDSRPGKAEIRLRLGPGATAYGVDAERIASQVRAAYFGVTADEVQVGPEAVEIEVRLAAADRARIDELDNFPIALADGRQIPLGAVAEIERARGLSRIHRIDRQRAITVFADVDLTRTTSAQILGDTEARFLPRLVADHPGLRIAFGGERSEAGETQRSIVQRFLLGLFFVFLILSFQFRSYLEPFAVMLAIPLALIGVLWGHLLLGFDLTMPSLMGFVSLAGIVVNDSILLVQALKARVADGLAVAEAAVEAARARFRAVFLTSITTIAGLLPLLAETSVQAQVLQPLVTSVVFGIASATLLVLFVVPVFYAVLDDFGLTRLHPPEPQPVVDT